MASKAQEVQKVLVDGILLANFIWEVYDRMTSKGIEITPDNIRVHIAGLKQQALDNNEAMGIDQ